MWWVSLGGVPFLILVSPASYGLFTGGYGVFPWQGGGSWMVVTCGVTVVMSCYWRCSRHQWSFHSLFLPQLTVPCPVYYLWCSWLGLENLSIHLGCCIWAFHTLPLLPHRPSVGRTWGMSIYFLWHTPLWWVPYKITVFGLLSLWRWIWHIIWEEFCCAFGPVQPMCLKYFTPIVHADFSLSTAFPSKQHT